MAWDDAWNSEAGGSMLQPGVVRGDEYYNAIAHARARAQAEAAEQAVRDAQAVSAAQAARYAAAREDGAQYVEAMQRLMYGEPRSATRASGAYLPGYGVVDAALDPAVAGWRGNLPGPLPRGTWADYTYANNVNPVPGIVFGGMGGAQHLVGYPSSHPLVLQTGLIDTAYPFMAQMLPYFQAAWAQQRAMAGGASTGGSANGGRQRSKESGESTQAAPSGPVVVPDRNGADRMNRYYDPGPVVVPDRNGADRMNLYASNPTTAPATTVTPAAATPAAAETWVPGVGFVPDPIASTPTTATPVPIDVAPDGTLIYDEGEQSRVRTPVAAATGAALGVGVPVLKEALSRGGAAARDAAALVRNTTGLVPQYAKATSLLSQVRAALPTAIRMAHVKGGLAGALTAAGLGGLYNLLGGEPEVSAQTPEQKLYQDLILYGNEPLLDGALPMKLEDGTAAYLYPDGTIIQQ